MNLKKNNSISVLMCVYNGDDIEHFREAINSLKIQSKFIDELIIVKNGLILDEHEETIKNIEKYINTKIIYLDKNIGLAKALNRGLNFISSMWVARFDSDDICHKDRFKIMKEKINSYGDKFDIFGFYIEEFNKSIGDLQMIRKVPLNLKDIKNRLLLSNPINHVTVIFKRELLKKFTTNKEDFYPLIEGFEDYALWVKLIRQNVKFINFPIVTVFVRIGNNMLSRRGGLKYIKSELKFRFYINKFIDPSKIILSYLISIMRIFVFLSPNIIKKFFYILKRKFI